MKRTNPVFMVLFIVTVFLLSAASVWAQAAPAFDQQPSVVLDLWSNSKGKYKDSIKLVNATSLQNITFNVYGYDEKKKEWTLIGTTTLKFHVDSDKIEAPKGVNIKNFRWFAVHSPSTIKFEAQAIADKSNDIYITILDKIPAAAAQQGNDAPAFSLPSSIVLPLSGRYKDSLEFKNATGKQDAAFNVWGYDQKNGQWVILGPKSINPDVNAAAVSTAMRWAFGVNVSPDEVDTPWKDRLNEFKWIAVQSLNGLSFNAQAVASSNDIKITVSNK